MVRQGRCRCGSVLRFEKGPHGYKTRCPNCGSVVRLRIPKKKSAVRGRSPGQLRVPDRPETPRLESARDDIDPSHRSASALSPHPVPGSRPRGAGGRVVTCEVCRTLVPAEAAQCPGCGTAFDLTTAAPVLDPKHSGGRRTTPESPSRLSFGWLAAGSAVLLAAVIALVLVLRH
jgi:hypothetical protein